MAPRKTAAKADPFAETKKEEEPVTETNTENATEISATLKGGAGFDAPWIVVRGNDVAELTEILNSDELRELLDKAADRGAYFSSKGPSGGGGARRTGGGRPGPKEHPKGKTMSCTHGQREYKSGFSQRTGKQWAAFDCPEGICDREWDND